MAKHLSGMAAMFQKRFQDLVDDMRDAQMHCYTDSNGVHYIQFGDGSVMVEPDAANNLTFDINEWLDFENADHITECGVITEDEQVTAILKASL